MITVLPSFQNKSHFQHVDNLHVVVSGASRRELIIGWLGSSYIDKPSSQSGYYASCFQPTMLSVESSRVLRVSRDSRAQCRNVAQSVIMQCSIVSAKVQKCAIMLQGQSCRTVVNDSNKILCDVPLCLMCNFE